MKVLLPTAHKKFSSNQGRFWPQCHCSEPPPCATICPQGEPLPFGAPDMYPSTCICRRWAERHRPQKCLSLLADQRIEREMRRPGVETSGHAANIVIYMSAEQCFKAWAKQFCNVQEGTVALIAREH